MWDTTKMVDNPDRYSISSFSKSAIQISQSKCGSYLLLEKLLSQKMEMITEIYK